jgi:hypothetical protein
MMSIRLAALVGRDLLGIQTGHLARSRYASLSVEMERDPVQYLDATEVGMPGRSLQDTLFLSEMPPVFPRVAVIFF